MRNALFILILVMSASVTVEAQPSPNALHFSLLKKNGKLHNPSWSREFKISVFSLVGAKQAVVMNNKPRYNKMVDKSGFIIDLGWGQAMIRSIIKIEQRDQEMWIDVHASGKFNIQLDSIKFKPGYYLIDERNFIIEPSEVQNTVDLTPAEWVPDHNSSIKQMVFPDNWDRWGPTDLILTLASENGALLNPKKRFPYRIQIRCEDLSGTQLQHQIINNKSNDGGLILDSGFVANFSREQSFIVVIDIVKGEETMRISTKTNWLRSLSLNRIPFLAGNYEIDVQQILKERYFEDINESPEDQFYNRRYDITPVKWDTIQ